MPLSSRRRFLSSVVSLAVVASSSPALAKGLADEVTVEAPYVRLPPPGAKNTGAFMVLKNRSSKALKVLGARSAAAKVTELHSHVNDGGVMRMRQIPAIELPAKGQAVLKPGDLHVMLIDLVAPLEEGKSVAMTLELEDGSTVAVTAPVRRPDVGAPRDAGAPAPAAAGHVHAH